MAPGLAFKILAHLEELGLLQPGGTVLDPMAGIGTSLLVAAIRGYRAVGVELEEKFVSMARANAERIALKGFGAPIEVIQGDARHLSELLAEKGMVSVVSPPYTQDGRLNRGFTDASLGNGSLGYGTTEGQIGALPDTPITVTSPPYAFETAADYQGMAQLQKEGAKFPRFNLKYGTTEGQIGRLGEQEGKENYLSAMALVYAEIAKVSPVLVVVVKDPTRDGKLRLLGRDTWLLMEQAGYRIVDYHRSILFEEQEQGHLFEGKVKQLKGRLGFFKRLAYRKGSMVANFEHVLIGVKEGGG